VDETATRFLVGAVAHLQWNRMNGRPHLEQVADRRLIVSLCYLLQRIVLPCALLRVVQKSAHYCYH